MTVVGISTIKDEADIIGPVIDRMLTQVDQILVADNLSTDGTFDILKDKESSGMPVAVLIDEQVAYYQSRKMSWLSYQAHERYGADWVIPFDADEVWVYGPDPATRIRDYLSTLPDHVSIVEASLFDHVATGLDPADSNPLTRIRWRRRKPAELVKVACRPIAHVVIEQGNHGAHYPSNRAGDLMIHHYPYRTAEQFIRKSKNGAVAYAATDLPESRGAHWRQYGRLAEALGDEALADVFREWFWTASPETDSTLVFDPA